MREPVVFTKIALGAIALGAAGVTTPTVVMMTQSSDRGHSATVTSAAPDAPSGNSGMQASSRRDRDHVHVTLRNAQGAAVGYVDLNASGDATQVSVRAWNLTPGFHGFHIHAAGLCNPASTPPFASAGGHFNPSGTAEGMQAGAFPVLLAGKDGSASAEFRDGNVLLNQLFGPAGTSVVVHAMPDNYANIPARYTSGGVAGPDTETQMTGDGGTRVACGVIAPPATAPTTGPTAGQPGPGTPAPTATPTSTMPAPQMPGMPTPAPSQPAPSQSGGTGASPAPTTSQPVPTTPAPSPVPSSTVPTHF
jgi:Cu-Zn family superoxide dismutase